MVNIENSGTENDEIIFEVEDDYPLLRGRYKLFYQCDHNPLTYSLKNIQFPVRLQKFLLRQVHLDTLRDLLKVDYDFLLQQANIGAGTLNTAITYIEETFDFELVEENYEQLHFFDPYKNGFLQWMDDVGERIPEREFQILLERWGISSKQKTLAKIAENYSLTRERIRQILRKSQRRLKAMQTGGTRESYLKYCFDYMVEKPKVLTFGDICTAPLDDSQVKYSPIVYLSFLSEMLDCVPFENNIKKSFDQKLKKISKISGDTISKYYKELQSRALPFGKVTVEKLFEQFDLINKDDQEKMRLLKTILSTQNLKFVNDNNKYFLIRNSNLKDITKDILLGSEKAMDIKEIKDIIKKFYNVSKKYNSITSLMGNINRNEDIYLLDRTKFGLIEHFSYQEKEWKEIIKKSESFLLNLKRQSNVIEVLDNIKPTFPRICSKYELVHMLRMSKSIIDIGFFNFCHSSLNIEERSKIVDVIEKIFTKTPGVYHIDEIIDLIKEIRFTRAEGMGILLNGIDYLENYKGGYFGRKDLHKKNLDELSLNTDYISKVLTKELYPDTTIEDIRNYFIDFKIENILQTISTSEDFFVKDINNSGNELVFVKHWTINKLMKFLLYNIKDNLFRDEVNWYFREMGKSLDEIDTHRLNRAGIGYKDDKYFILEENFDHVEDEDILDLAYKIIRDSSSMLMIDDIYDELNEYENGVMLNKDELEYQIRNDKRFILTDNNLVTIYE